MLLETSGYLIPWLLKCSLKAPGKRWHSLMKNFSWKCFHDIQHPDALGAPLDLIPIIGDMITYNGGPIQSHA